MAHLVYLTPSEFAQRGWEIVLEVADSILGLKNRMTLSNEVAKVRVVQPLGRRTSLFARTAHTLLENRPDGRSICSAVRPINAAHIESDLHSSCERVVQSREYRIRARSNEFSDGRQLAAELLFHLKAPITVVGVGSNREPLWPTGFVGSISHSRQRVAAAVASNSHYRAIGLDIEYIINAEMLPCLLRTCVSKEELALQPVSALDYAEFFTLCFSAKEAFYKCLFPLCNEFFDFSDVVVESVNSSKGEIEIRLLKQLNVELNSNYQLVGRFEFREGYVAALFNVPSLRSNQ